MNVTGSTQVNAQIATASNTLAADLSRSSQPCFGGLAADGDRNPPNTSTKYTL